MVTAARIWLLFCLFPAVRTAADICAGRGSLRGHAENQTVCSVDGRVFRHAPAALLAKWHQFVSLRTVQKMRGHVHHLARRKRSAGDQTDNQEPCCQPQYSLMLPLTAISSDTGRRIQLAQSPPHQVQPVLVVSCDDRCPHTNATCKQMHAPQMLLRLSGRRLQYDLVDVESGCQCDTSNDTKNDVTEPSATTDEVTEPQTTTQLPREEPRRVTSPDPPGPSPKTDTTTAATEGSATSRDGTTSSRVVTEAGTTGAVGSGFAMAQAGATTTKAAITTEAATTTEAAAETDTATTTKTTIATAAVTTMEPATITEAATTMETAFMIEGASMTGVANTTESATITEAATKEPGATMEGTTSTEAAVTAEVTIVTKGHTMMETATTIKATTTNVSVVKTEMPESLRNLSSDSQRTAMTMTTAASTTGTTTAPTSATEIPTAVTAAAGATMTDTAMTSTTTSGTSSDTSTAGTTTSGSKTGTITAATTTEGSTTIDTTPAVTSTAGSASLGIATMDITKAGGSTTSAMAATIRSSTTGTNTIWESTTWESATGMNTTAASTATASTASSYTTDRTTHSSTAKTAPTEPITKAPQRSTSAPFPTAGARVQPTPTRPQVTVTEVSTVCPGTATPGPPSPGVTEGALPPVALALLAEERMEEPFPTRSDRAQRAEGTETERAAEAGGGAGRGSVNAAGITADDSGDAGPLRGDMAPQDDRGGTAFPGYIPQPPLSSGPAPLLPSGPHQTHNLSQALLHLAGLAGVLPQWRLQPGHLSEDHIRLAGLLWNSYSLGRGSCGRRSALAPPWAPAPEPTLQPVPAVSEEEQRMVEVISSRSAVRTPQLAQGRSVDLRRDGSLVVDRMDDLTDDLPLGDARLSLTADRRTSMMIVRNLMTRQRKALNNLHSKQLQQLDRQLKLQRQAIQRTFNDELRYVKEILTAIDPERPDEDEDDGEKEDYGGEDVEEDYSGEDEYADDDEDDKDYEDEVGEEDYSQEDGEDTDKDDGPDETGLQGTVSQKVTGPIDDPSSDPSTISEDLDVNVANTTTLTTGSPNISDASTPFARSQTTAPPQCPPFEEGAALDALTRDSRVLMNTLMKMGVGLLDAMRPGGPTARSVLAEPRMAFARSGAGREMTRLVRVVAGSEVRFQFSLTALEEHTPALERLQELLEARAGQAQTPGGTEYNLTTAVTALSSCIINGVPGFRMEQSLDVRTASSLTIRQSSRLQDRGRSASSVALRLSAIFDHIWTLFRFFFNTFIHKSSSIELRTDENLRVLSLRPSELRVEVQRAVSGLTPARRDEVRQLLTNLASHNSDVQYALSETRQLMRFFANISDVLLTGGSQAVQAGPSAVIRSIGDSLLGGLSCFYSSLAGTWSPATTRDATTNSPVPVHQPACQPLEDISQAILSYMPVFAEMLYKVVFKFTSAFSVGPQSRGAAATPRLSGASAASLQIQQLVSIVAGSTARFTPPLTVAEGYLSQMDRLVALLTAPDGTPAGEPVQQDHNLTAAVALMTACFVDHVPGFELRQSADAKSASSLVGRMEEVHIPRMNALPEDRTVVTRLSVVMVNVWTNWIAIFNRFVKPSMHVELRPSTNVRVLFLRESALRESLLSAISSLSPERLGELGSLCAELAAGAPQLQFAVYELRYMMNYTADITDRLLTSRSVGRQAIAAGPSAVIRHMGRALLHSLECFSAALAGGEAADLWGTPSPPSAPPSAPPPPEESASEPPQCQIMEEANSDDTILEDLEPLMKYFFDMGLTFFDILKPSPDVFISTSPSESVPESSESLPESRSASSEAPVGSLMTWLLDSLRLSAGRYWGPLGVMGRYMDMLERLWFLMEAGAASSPLGKPQTDHNLTEAVSALTACFVEYVPGYHLEQTLEAKTTGLEALQFQQQQPHKTTATDSFSITLRVTDVMTYLWRVVRSILGVFVRQAASVTLHPEKNIRVLSLSRPQLRSGLRRAISGLDVLQREELSRVCGELTAAELSFAVAEVKLLMSQMAKLARLRLTKAARSRQAAAGPAAIVTQMMQALPHSYGCFLTALAGRESESPSLPPQATEIPATAPPGVSPIPGLPLTGEPATRAPPQLTTTQGDSTEHGDSLTDSEERPTELSPEEEDEDGMFLTEQDGDLVDDILSGLG